MKQAVGYLLMGTAFIACPCHLIFLLPAALGLLGGTALGAALAASTSLVIAAATVYFVAALGAGLYLLNRRTEKGAGVRPGSLIRTEVETTRDLTGHASHGSRERTTRK